MSKPAILLSVVLMAFVSVLSYAQAPVPFISQPLMPDATAPGGPQFTLTVNGTGFVSTSVVNWSGSALATQFVNGSQLKATVPAANLATASTASIAVVNPAPGGGTSNVVFFTITANTGNSAGFGLDSSLAAGPGPYSVAVGDFNGDGRLDLAVVNYVWYGKVSILLGYDTGKFELTSTLTVGGMPMSVAVGDFNGDGRLDLAVGNSSNKHGNTVSILLGDGTGKFTLAPSVSTSRPYAVAVGDFNGDGKLDLVAANNASATVSILLGDGTGNFTLASAPAVGQGPSSVAVGDFNGDDKLDLAVGNLFDATVSILLGDGTGNFILASSLPTGQIPRSVAVGDFNGDGKLDLAVSGCGNGLCILVGDGTGNFTFASSPPYGSQSVAVGDFNGDGKLDLALAGCDNGVCILLGDGTGNFTLAWSLPTGYFPVSVAVGDFNGDGKLDLAVANTTYGGTVSILLAAIPPVVLSPTNLNFGTQLVRTKSAQSVTLTNIGSSTLDITSIVVAGTHYSENNNCPSSVPPGGQCTINVKFRPPFRGTFTGTVTITDNAPTSPQTVPLTGVGTAVTLLPSSMRFGNQSVGTTSEPQMATFTNHATAPVIIHRIHITGSNHPSFAQTNTCGTSVPPGGSCTISVTFTPKSKGAKTATLEVRDNAGGGPQTVVVNGRGTP